MPQLLEHIKVDPNVTSDHDEDRNDDKRKESGDKEISQLTPHYKAGIDSNSDSNSDNNSDSNSNSEDEREKMRQIEVKRNL